MTSSAEFGYVLTEAARQRMERLKRREAVQQAITSTRLEGGSISPQLEGWFQEYIDGKMEIDEIVELLLKPYTAPESSNESPHHS